MKRNDLNQIIKEANESHRLAEEIETYGIKTLSKATYFENGIPDYLNEIIISTIKRFSKRRKLEAEYYVARPFLIEE